MKSTRIVRALCAAAVCLAMAGFAKSAGAATCTIDGNSPSQAIDGFGFSTAWSGRMSSTLADTMFGTGAGQLGMSILRIRIDPNKNWSDETANASSAHARGVKVFGTPWTPPVSMKTNNNVNHGSLRTDQYAAYATYLNQAISSIGLDIISLQNEPDWDPDYEGCVWTGQQFHDWIAANGSTLTKPIMMPESLQFRDEMSDPTLNDPSTAAKVSIVAGHFYGGGNRVHTNALSKGKHVWETENYIDGVDSASTAVQVAKTISDAMNNQFSAYLWWWLNATDANAGLVTTGGQPHKNAYTVAQFAKFVRPGMTRIGTTYNPSTNVYVTAYKNSGTISIVAINTGTSSVSQQFALSNLSASSLNAVRTSSSENLATVSAASVSGGSFTYNLPAQSITTFSGPIGGTGTTYALNVTKSGTGSGTVTSSVGGINCGSACSASLSSGTSVTLTAAAASGSTFSSWSGACTGTGSCVVTMTAAQSVGATFAAQQQTGGPISINAGGSATGTFVADVDYSGGSTYSTTTTIDTSLISGTAPAQAVFQSERYGEFTYTIPGLTAGGAYTVTLYFAESYWTAAGQRTFNVAINGAAVLTAFDIYATAGGTNKAVAKTFNTTANSSGQVAIAFTKGGGPDNPKISGIAVASGVNSGYTLTVVKSGTGSGTVAGGPISCGSTCSAANLTGDTAITLTATPASGSSFAGWTGACSGIGSCVVTPTVSQTVTATFILNTSSGYTLTVTKAGTGAGTVAGGPISCGSTCSATNLASGTVVTLTASVSTGSTFAGWSGACSGTSASCVVTLTASQSVTATFNTSSTGNCTTASGGQSGNFNTTGAICFSVSATIHGWGCSNADGRTVSVNGTAVTCGQTPLPGSSPYTFSFTAGSYPWASFYWW